MKVVNILQLGDWLTTDGKFGLFVAVWLDVEVSR